MGLIHRISRVFRCATSAGGSLSRTRPGVSSVSNSVRLGTTASGGAGGFGSTGGVGRRIVSSGRGGGGGGVMRGHRGRVRGGVT